MQHSDGTETFLLAEPVEQDGACAPTRDAGRSLGLCAAVLQDAAAAEGGAVLLDSGRFGLLGFDTAAAAARAAVRVQSSFAGSSPDRAPIRVRVALYSGPRGAEGCALEPHVLDRAGRLVAVAHGGQVLVSEATATLLRENGDSFCLRDLGRLRLRDLGPPQRVYQLVVPQLRSEYPALRSLDNPDLPNNLPTLSSPFVGREREVEEVRRALLDARLVTLTGAGGAGKTRLSLQAAAGAIDAMADGVWVVELAPVADEQRVASAIVAALEIPESDSDAMEILVRALAGQSVLLVLDNCEHLVGKVAKVVDVVLRTCPGVKILATSREPLGVDGEHVYRVPSMGIPDEDVLSLAEARSSDAAELFVGRAREAGASFDDADAPLIASVCRRLDGIPLALELAAARLSSISLAELSERLDQRFRLLTGGARSAMARQQTLQALVDWSYELLNPFERQVLQRLSVFAGSFDLRAAEVVCAGDGIDEIDVLNLLHSLVEKSLALADHEWGVTRYRLLETIRQYGAAELLRSEGDLGVLDARDRHASHFLDLARRAAPLLQGPDVGEWMRRLELEAGNLDAAIAHLVEDRPLEVLELVADLERFFNFKGAVDVIPPTLQAVSRVDHADRRNAELVSAALISVCMIIWWHLIGKPEEVTASVKYVERAEELARHVRRTDLEARALMYKVIVDVYRGDVESASRNAELAEQLARRSRKHSVLCEALVNSLHWSVVEHRGLSPAAAQAVADEALGLARQDGDLTMVARAIFWYASQALQEERLDDARRLYEENLDLAHQIGADDGMTLNNYLIVCLAQGDFEAAIHPLKKCLRRMRRSGFRSNPGDLIAAGACIASARGDHLEGAQLHGAADEIRRPGYERGELYRTPADEAIELASIARIREHVGDVEFDKASLAGRRLSMAQACDLALAVLR